MKFQFPALICLGAVLCLAPLSSGCGGNEPAPGSESAAAHSSAAPETAAPAGEGTPAPGSESAAPETSAEENAVSVIGGADGPTSIFLAGKTDDPVDYSDPASWAFLGEGDEDAAADVFFVCPTVYGGTDDSFLMPLDDEDAKESFVGATRMEMGIYDEDARFFAPYYRQAGLNVYELPADAQELFLSLAYEDVEDAFEYYWDNCREEERPLILAGFSQGADMCIRLMKECFGGEERLDQLVACYAIGWRITDEELEAYPQLKMASGEDDTGVIISFNSEAEGIDDSLMIPAGTKTHAINPLNWKTDSTPAGKELNLGACFTDYSGEITAEIPQLTGAYLDPARGALKVPDVTPEDYPAGLPIFEDGVYHLYDYQFFYRNLQENVRTRLNAFTGKAA